MFLSNSHNQHAHYHSFYLFPFTCMQYTTQLICCLTTYQLTNSYNSAHPSEALVQPSLDLKMKANGCFGGERMNDGQGARIMTFLRRLLDLAPEGYQGTSGALTLKIANHTSSQLICN
jgi:hypothetical protein